MNIYDEYVEGINCPVYAGFFGVMGATAAIVFSCEFKAIPNFVFSTMFRPKNNKVRGACGERHHARVLIIERTTRPGVGG